MTVVSVNSELRTFRKVSIALKSMFPRGLRRLATTMLGSSKGIPLRSSSQFACYLKSNAIIVFFFFLDFKLEPVNITSSVPSSTGVRLQWKPLDPYKLGEPVLGYRIEICDLLRGECFNYTVNSSMTDANLNILKPFTPYKIKVFGVTSSWEGNITDTMGLKTQEDGRLS